MISSWRISDYHCKNLKETFWLLFWTMSKLPPLHNLPSWSRSSLERRKVQRSITKDPELPNHKWDVSLVPRVSIGEPTRKNSGVRIVSAPSSRTLDEETSSKKEAQLINSINFLKQQHQETLEKLHEEIERLKTENKGNIVNLCVSWCVQLMCAVDMCVNCSRLDKFNSSGI